MIISGLCIITLKFNSYFDYIQVNDIIIFSEEILLCGCGTFMYLFSKNSTFAVKTFMCWRALHLVLFLRTFEIFIFFKWLYIFNQWNYMGIPVIFKVFSTNENYKELPLFIKSFEHFKNVITSYRWMCLLRMIIHF